MSAIFQIFYVSRATSVFDIPTVQSILQISRRNNSRRDVTGCLLFSGRHFAQVLEGEASIVQELAARIAADPRHGGIRFLNEASRAAREYGDWSMGYLHDLNLEDDLETLLLIPNRSPVVVADVMERMCPEPVMGAPR
jgi:hypothetical protein